MGFYSDPSIFSGAYAAVRQTEINKETGADARGGKYCGEKLGRRGWCLRGGKDVSDGALRDPVTVSCHDGTDKEPRPPGVTAGQFQEKTLAPVPRCLVRFHPRLQGRWHQRGQVGASENLQGDSGRHERARGGQDDPHFSKAEWCSWVALNTGSAFRETQRGPRPLGQLAVEKTSSPLKLLEGPACWSSG